LSFQVEHNLNAEATLSSLGPVFFLVISLLLHTFHSTFPPMNFSSNASMSLIELDTIRVAGTTFLIVEDSSTSQNHYSSARILTGYVIILLL
jgi:hypothetical protein